ncbi:MAG: DUF445 domain-containing protein [Microbacteriaceae bacterium]|nr:MAG: DUF445 domain-containing protein [Microbacteriaceae bacterium]
MKAIALGLLIGLTAVFAVAFALEGRYPWLHYVRATAEGGMVGALADWFAVTALFRHPLGLKIPHTAIIPNRKDEIGESLGEFVETNFLSETVVRGKLESIDLATSLGSWLAQPRNARRVTAEASTALRGVATMLDDEDMKTLIESIVHRHVLDPLWGPPLGRIGEKVIASGGHREAVDLVFDRLDTWVSQNPDAFGTLASARLPSWVPSVVSRFVDDTVYREAQRFVREVRENPDHKLRQAIDGYLTTLTERLQNDPATIAKLEDAKNRAFDDPRVRELAGDLWDAARAALLVSLADESSALRRGIASALIDVGNRLATDAALGTKVNAWATDAASHLVSTYRHEIVGIITDTVKRWDPTETTEKIELQVGRDLQFIRINGTVVGSVAGLVTFAIASAVFGGPGLGG